MSAPVPASAHLSIGEVLACLRPDFPDLTISKIRFYEAAGLVEPARTPAGYRKFSARDVERLRYVLTAKQDHYLPLRVIRDQLEALDAAGEPVAPSAPAAPNLDLAPSGTRLTRAQMLTETGLTEAQLSAIDESGLLNRRRGGHYDADDVTIARIVAALEQFGLQPRHLRAFKGAADREVGLVEQAVAAAPARTTEEREAARQAATDLAAELTRLHAALLQAGLRRTYNP